MCVCVSSLRNVKLCSFLKVEKKIFSPCVILKSLRCGRETISNLSVEGGASRNSGRSAGFLLQRRILFTGKRDYVCFTGRTDGQEGADGLGSTDSRCETGGEFKDGCTAGTHSGNRALFPETRGITARCVPPVQLMRRQQPNHAYVRAQRVIS